MMFLSLLNDISLPVANGGQLHPTADGGEASWPFYTHLPFSGNITLSPLIVRYIAAATCPGSDVFCPPSDGSHLFPTFRPNPFFASNEINFICGGK